VSPQPAIYNEGVVGIGEISLCELQRAARVLDKRLAGAVVQRIVQRDEFRLVVTFHSPQGTLHLSLNCHPEFARPGLLAEAPPAPAVPPAFAQYLRAHLGRAAFAGAAAAAADRRLEMTLRAREGEFRLVFSIFGRRSNVYLLGSGGVLLFAMRRPADTRPELVVGAPWIDPPSQLRSQGSERWAGVPDDLYLETIERSYAEFEEAKARERLARRIEQALDKEIEFLGKKAANLAEDLGAALHAEEYRRRGELLKGALGAIRPGADSVTVTDYETGEEVRIPLDPRLSAAANLEACFKRYRKELRGIEAIRRQMEIVRADLEELEALQEKLRASEANLQELAQHPRLRRLLGRRRPSPAAGRTTSAGAGGRQDTPARLLPRRFRSSHGLEIWVGKSDEGNDYLTRRLARGNDLFFHLEGYPGSHVILRTEGRKDIPPDALLEACELAVHYSSRKDAPSADVHMVHVKDIRKPKGARPGLVYAAKGKTIHLRRSRIRLEGILAARLDE
jgi:predicted ribosome quality control (RQC) complex YloA/Tae2 family protein